MNKVFLLVVLIVTVLCPVQMYAEQGTVFEDVYYTTDEALKKVFPSATKIESSKYNLSEKKKSIIESRLGTKLKSNHYVIFTGYDEDTIMGYAIIIDEQGKYHPMTIMTCISPEFIVNNVVLMVYREKIGASVRKSRFTKQFHKKTSQHKLRVDQDIAAVSGATVSSYSMANAVRKSIFISEELFQES